MNGKTTKKGETTVKRLIAATIAVAAVGILVTACAQSKAAVQQVPDLKRVEPVVQPTSSELIQEARHATSVVGVIMIMTGQGDWTQLAASLKDMDKAEQELQQLDEQLKAAMFVSGLNIMISATNAAEAAEDIRNIENARQEVLARIGLAQERLSSLRPRRGLPKREPLSYFRLSCKSLT